MNYDLVIFDMDGTLVEASFDFDHISTRDDFSCKPHPDSILKITQILAISPKRTLMVGDYLFDLQAAQAAGTDSALICHDPQNAWPDYASMATYTVQTLSEIVKIATENESRIKN